MPKITYVLADRSEQTLDLPLGISVMRGAVVNDIDGIVGQCGGNAQCGTCHVFVDRDSLDKTGEVGPDEDDMLEFTACAREPNSRLSCQLTVEDSLDGLIVHVPERQF